MPLYSVNSWNLSLIKEEIFNLEIEIQSLTEKNLKQIFDLELIKSEFALNGLRIDTLAFDKESNSFVIIEYKRDKNFSVIDQGYAYLSLMLNNKADFILEYNENTDTSLKRDDVDRSQSRVIFVSPSFSKYQQQAINFKDLPIELWEINKYQNNLLQYNKLKAQDSSESIKKISKWNQLVNNVIEEIKVYTEEDHLDSSVGDNIKSLYEEFKNLILSLDDWVIIEPKKKYIAFKVRTNFIDIVLQKWKIKFWLNVPKGKLDDPYNLWRDVLWIGRHWNGDYEFNIHSKADFVKVMPLIEQSLKINS